MKGRDVTMSVEKNWQWDSPQIGWSYPVLWIPKRRVLFPIWHSWTLTFFLSFLKEVEGDLIIEIRMMLEHAQLHLTPSFLLETEPVSENTRSMLLNPGSCPHRKVKKDVPIAAMTKRVTLTSWQVQYFQAHLTPTHKAMPFTKTLLRGKVASWCQVVPCSGLV